MEDITGELQRVVAELYGLSVTPEVTPAPANLAADYSSNLPLQLTQSLHRPPLAIAEELAAALDSASAPSGSPSASKAPAANSPARPFRVTVTPPGFLNFISPDEYLTAKIADLAHNFAENISLDEYSGQTVVCEFSDPNPFKVLHVGHLYTSIVGNAIANLFAAAGAKVIRANFGGDVGLHVAKTLYALSQKLHLPLSPTASPAAPADALTIDTIADCYIAGTAAYADDPAAKRRIDALNQEIYAINAAQRHDSPLAELYWRGRELSYRYFDDFYARIGVHFDKYYPESAVADLGLTIVQRELQNGVYERSAGAVVFNGEKYGLHTRVFINRAGVPTYETKDVGLLFAKWRDFHFDRSVVITGHEQLDYMKVVLKSVEQYAPDLVARTTHLTHGLVKLPGNEKMSSRQGNFIKAVDVLELVRQALADAYHSTDERIALAAVKYAFLKYKMGGDLIFDPAESVKMTGNSGPYLLYSCVRARKILAKNATSPSVPKKRSEAPGDAANSALAPAERALAKKLLDYRPTLRLAVAEMAPHKVAGYLYELAQDFSRFYETCPVTGSAQAAARLRLVQVYLDVMTHGLTLLGLDIPEEM